MHRLRTVTYLDVSPVAGHHAMPAALLFFVWERHMSIQMLGHPSFHLSFCWSDLVPATCGMSFIGLIVPRSKSKGTIVMGSSVCPSFHPSIRPSVDTILSPQLLLQFSRDFDETFQLLFPWPKDAHILSKSCSTDFYQSYGPLTIFQQ